MFDAKVGNSDTKKLNNLALPEIANNISVSLLLLENDVKHEMFPKNLIVFLAIRV